MFLTSFPNFIIKDLSFFSAPPSPPVNCSLVGSGRETVTVNCDPGDPGVLPHTYNIRIYEALTRTLFINKTSKEPRYGIFSLTLFG